MNIDYKIKKECFKMQVQNEKELIQIPIDMFYEDFTVYDDNQRVAFENFSENKRYIIEYQDNDNVYVYKPTMQDLIKIMEENLKPLPINELLDKQFFVPHYQRGYRWTNQQVEQLLDDIDSFSPREVPGKSNQKTFYCLQPIVVKLMDDEAKKVNKLADLYTEELCKWWLSVADHL